MPEPLTMLGVAATPQELDRPPSTADVRDVDRDARVPWPTRIQSLLVGLVLGALVGSTVLVFLLLPQGVLWPIGSTLALGVAFFVTLRTGSGLDARWVLVAAIGVLLALAAAPWPEGTFASSVVLCIAAGVMTWILLKAVLMIRGVRADVLEWNAAYERLAQDPRRAQVRTLTVEVEDHGSHREFVGEVTYVDAEGRERVVPLVSAATARVQFPAETTLSENSPCVVWHTATHDVVHTVVLRDRV